MRLLERLIGRWRLYRGYCPACNLDAPAVDTCDVCANYHAGKPWPPDHLQLESWRRRWEEKHDG